MTVGERIRLIRKNKKVSIRKLAEMTGLSKSTLSEIENNVSKNPTIDTLDKVAKALDAAISELIGSNEDMIESGDTMGSKDKEWANLAYIVSTSNLSESEMEVIKVQTKSLLQHFLKNKDQNENANS